MTLAFVARARDPAIASFRYRVLAPIQFLTDRSHAVELYDEARFDQYDTVVFSKAYRAEHQALARRLRKAGKTALLDLCDDHFFNPNGLASYDQARTDLLAMIKAVDAVICATPVLAAAVQREAGLASTPAIAPDVFEQAEARVCAPSPPDRPARLLWFGRHASPNASAGMSDLMLICDDLADAYAKRPFELVVCSDSRPLFDELFGAFPIPARYVEWSPETFTDELGRADAVLIPLSDNPFVAAKTHNRLSLALSAGVPVVADRLDSYAPFAPYCRIGDWAAGLEAVLLRPLEERARAAGALEYLQANWSSSAVAIQWEVALGLAPAVGGRARMTVEPGRPIPHALAWLASERRNERSWLLAGEEASLEAVTAARRQGFLVMSVDGAMADADVACVIDAETLVRQGEALTGAARVLMLPSDVHLNGWATGRSLASWAADMPALWRMREDDRLVQFDLWTGGRGGIEGDVRGVEVPLRLLANAGVRLVRTLGLRAAPRASAGFDGLSSIAERRGGGVAALLASRRISFGPYDPDPASAAPTLAAIPAASNPTRSSTSAG